MSTTDHSQVLTARGTSAATEYLMADKQAPGLWVVDNGKSDPDEHEQYVVEPDAPACTCPDWEYRSEQLGDDGCKHIRRVRMVRGDLDLGPLLETDERINPILARRLDIDEDNGGGNL